MQPHGSDRVRIDGDRIVLSSRIDKGWRARVAKTLTSPEHPGTAVFGDDDVCYEVIEAAMQPQGGVRYVLGPWRDEHAIRVSDRYDEESEARRIAEHSAEAKRRKQAGAASLLAIVAGHLPAVVQERMAFELGLLPARMSLYSLLLPMAFVAWLVYSSVAGIMHGLALAPWKIVAGGFFFAESMFRFSIIATQSRPAGSSIGVLLYLLAYAIGPRQHMTDPFARTKGTGTFTLPPEEDQLLRDEMLMKAPYATLLTPDEQRRLEARFGFDHRRHAYGVAIALLVAGVVGAASSIATLRRGGGVTAVLSLVAAGGIAVEQLVRLAALSRGPAASILGFLVRPLLRRLL